MSIHPLLSPEVSFQTVFFAFIFLYLQTSIHLSISPHLNAFFLSLLLQFFHYFPCDYFWWYLSEFPSSPAVLFHFAIAIFCPAVVYPSCNKWKRSEWCRKAVVFLSFYSRNSLISPPDSHHGSINSGISRAEGLELWCKGLDFAILNVILQLEGFLPTTLTFQSQPPWHMEDITAGFSVAFSSNIV